MISFICLRFKVLCAVTLHFLIIVQEDPIIY